MQRATGIDVSAPGGAQKAADKVIDELGIDILLTRSEKGMSLFRKGYPAEHCASRVREVFDVSGAGDTAIAAFATAVGSGANAVDLMRFANTAAG